MESRLPAPSLSRPRSWIMVFGPGAIIASLTIGSGELVFSSRGGALFGYSLLSTFLVVCLLKWALVFCTARHLVLTGQHPFERWAKLPGPRGWLPAVFLLFAGLCFPIWVAFHAGTVGTLLAHLTGSTSVFNGAAHILWGILILAAVTWLALSGNYQRLERIQLVLVGVMLLTVALSLVFLQPDWSGLFAGFFATPPDTYPDWIHRYPDIAGRSVWLELGAYVGVIGGSGYDCLAYVSFLCGKTWGQSDQAPIASGELDAMARDPSHPNRAWVTAPLVDCTLSFLVVLLFSAVFLACGTEVLREREGAVPNGATLLTLQAQFVDHIGPWFGPVYFAGALLAMLGTLYGTLEVAPTILREGWRALSGKPSGSPDRQRRLTPQAVGLGGEAVPVLLFFHQLQGAKNQPETLVALLTPANLFTGVLACGLISWLAIWSDHRFLPRSLRPPWILRALLALGGALFFTLGTVAYAKLGPFKALAVFTGTLAIGWAVAAFAAANPGRHRTP